MYASARRAHPGPLSPKVYQLPEILVMNRLKAPSKIALQERLWPGTFVSRRTSPISPPRFGTRSGTILHTRVRADRASVRLRVSRRNCQASTSGSSAGGEAVRIACQWAGGRAVFGEGEQALGRDPDPDLFFDSPGVSRRDASIRIMGEGESVEDLGARTAASSRIAA